MRYRDESNVANVAGAVENWLRQQSTDVNADEMADWMFHTFEDLQSLPQSRLRRMAYDHIINFYGYGSIK